VSVKWCAWRDEHRQVECVLLRCASSVVIHTCFIFGRSRVRSATHANRLDSCVLMGYLVVNVEERRFLVGMNRICKYSDEFLHQRLMQRPFPCMCFVITINIQYFNIHTLPLQLIKRPKRTQAAREHICVAQGLCSGHAYCLSAIFEVRRSSRPIVMPVEPSLFVCTCSVSSGDYISRLPTQYIYVFLMILTANRPFPKAALTDLSLYGRRIVRASVCFNSIYEYIDFMLQRVK
jgi:hypothetical protein